MCNLFSNPYFIDKIFPSVVGASIGALIAVLGWCINIYYNYKLGLRNFKFQFYEKAFWKIEEKLSAYQDWLAKLAGELQGFDQRLIDVRGLPKIDYDEKREIIRALILEDHRSDDWFQVISNFEQMLPSYSNVSMALYNRQDKIQASALNLVKEIKGRSEGQSKFGITSEDIDRIQDQGKLIAELNGNLQYDCFKHIIKNKPPKIKVEIPKPFIQRDKSGKIILEE